MELIYWLNSVGKYCRNVILGCERLPFVQDTQKTRREFQHRECKPSYWRFGLKETLEKHPVQDRALLPVLLNREKKTTSASVTLNTFIQGSDTCCLPSNHTSQLAIICKPHNIPSLKAPVHYDLFIFISF